MKIKKIKHRREGCSCCLTSNGIFEVSSPHSTFTFWLCVNCANDLERELFQTLYSEDDLADIRNGFYLLNDSQIQSLYQLCRQQISIRIKNKKEEENSN